MLKKARLHTRPTLAVISPARLSLQGSLFAHGRVLSQIKAAASEEARRTLQYVEPLSDARTMLGKRRISARRGRADEKGGFF
jgi:hypothetical protein